MPGTLVGVGSHARFEALCVAAETSQVHALFDLAGTV